jgi:hypothetical protein
MAVLVLFPCAAEAAIQFRNQSSDATSGSATSLQVNKPTGCVDGDLLVAVFVSDDGGTTLNAPDGTWTAFALDPEPAEVNIVTRGWWKQASSEGATYTFDNGTNSSPLSLIIGCFYNDSGVGDWAIEDDSFVGDSYTNPLSTASVTGVANSLMIAAWGGDGGNDTVTTPPSGMTIIGSQQIAFPSTGSHAVAYWETRGAGPVTKSCEFSGTDDTSAMAAIFSWAVSGPPDLQQVHYRWRKDDAGEGGGGTVVLENSNQDDGQDGSGETFSFGFTATAGRLLVAGIACDKGCGTIELPSSGWAEIKQYSDSHTGHGLYYKVAAGGEDSIQFVYGATSNDSSVWVGEYSGLTADPFDKSAQDDTNDDPATSCSSGTTQETTQNDEFIIASWSADSGDYVQDGREYSNGFTERVMVCYHAGSGNESLIIAERIVSAMDAYETTFTTSDTGDEQSGIIATFKIATSAGATWAADEDTKLTGLAKGSTRRLRLEISIRLRYPAPSPPPAPAPPTPRWIQAPTGTW